MVKRRNLINWFFFAFLELFVFLLRVVALKSYPTSIKFGVESVKFQQILGGRDVKLFVYAVE